MTDAHFANFIAGVRTGAKLNAPVSIGNVAVTMLQLSNIAWFVNRELNLDTVDGKIKDDPEAMKYWDRTYEPGWEPRASAASILHAAYVHGGQEKLCQGTTSVAPPRFLRTACISACRFHFSGARFDPSGLHQSQPGQSWACRHARTLPISFCIS